MRIIGKLAIAATAAAAMLLTAPAANADVHANFLNVVNADMNGAIDVGLLGQNVFELPNVLAPLV